MAKNWLDYLLLGLMLGVASRAMVSGALRVVVSRMVGWWLNRPSNNN